jgi:hypothetical protein
VAALVFNIAKGRFARYCDLPAANDAIVWVALQSAGLEADAVLQDYATLSALLAAANDEATFTGYARIAHTASIVVTTDNTNNRVDVDDTSDPAWSPTSAQALGKIIACYDPDTTTGTDADLVPLFADDFALTTPTSGSVTYSVNVGGFLRAS